MTREIDPTKQPAARREKEAVSSCLQAAGTEIPRTAVIAARSPELLSDNCAPVCPEVINAIVASNRSTGDSYGADAFTATARDAFSELFGHDCDVYFVASGTAANGLSLAALCPSYESIICSKYAHVLKDEGGAVSFFTGGSAL